MLHLTKTGLYKQVANLRSKLGLEPDECGINTIELCMKQGIQISEYAFITPGLRGMAQIGDAIYPDGIILNSARNPTEQNVDCAHECMHLGIHRHELCRTFKCFEKVAPGQDKYMEWQANEGGAELLVPYRNLLQRIKRYEHLLHSHKNIMAFKDELKDIYNVTDAVITFRIESLKYETAQYLSGISLDELRVLSNTLQEKEGIHVRSLNDIATESYYNKDMDIYFERTIKNTASV